MNVDLISVEVALAFPEEQHLVRLRVPKGASIKRAIEMSNIFNKFHEVPDDVRRLEHGVGIFGKEVKDPASYDLKNGDRIEIYRPLTIDPKEARFKRVKKDSK